ncbi:hypothetical protein [Steroidobacter sp.]|uniref:hypothetical protein n=1 Tax=Steroidobacter sp. TaxID=1978227 RepID=UPI001A51A528|nr:hypothetical protein [Steroidobacter sp.]MBL8270974.1 hypothetical protein [Steroidobacter sp.]
MPVTRPGLVEMPDGEQIEVMLKPMPRGTPLGIELSDRLKDDYGPLRAMAEAGNAGAAMMLYDELERCREAFTTEASLNEALTRLKRDRVLIYRSANKKPQPIGQSSDPEQVAQSFLIKPAKRCAGTTDAQIAESPQWLERAAEGGDMRARLAWGQAKFGTPEAVTDFTQLWNEGNLYALQSLQMALLRLPDPATDYAYIYAYNLIELKLYEAAAATDRSRSYNFQLQVLGERSNYLQGFLNPQETTRANEIAAFLLRNNPNCCEGPW